MNRNRPRDDAEQALSLCQPGQRLAVWYNDDHVYHERILVWRVDGRSWYVVTPDKDLYVEDFSGLGENGPVFFRVKDVDFKAWSRLGKPVYRFSNPPTDDEFRAYVATALEELKTLSHNSDWQPLHVINMTGKQKAAAEYLGHLLVAPPHPRRRDGGHLEQPEEVGVPVAEEGMTWLCYSASADLEFGAQVVDGLARGVKLDSDYCAVPTPSGWMLCRKATVAGAPELVEQGRANIAVASAIAGPADPDPKLQPLAPLEDSTEDDARTLMVEYDEQGERFKAFRDVCRECKEYGFADWPHEGPQTTLHVLKFMQKNGGSPKLWLQVWSRHKGVHEGDRVMHEMRALVDCLEQGGCYDQLNLASLASFECLARRIQSIVDAYNAGSAASPDWGAALIITGYQGPEDVVMPSLRSWAAKRGKEEVELAAARTKIREHRRLIAPAEEAAAAAVADGSLPSGGAPTKPKRKAKAKTVAPPQSP